MFYTFFDVKRIIPVMLIAGMFCSCENDIEEVKLVTSRETLPAESMRNAEIIYSDSARLKVRITAPVLDRYVHEKKYQEFPEGVKVTFYNTNKQRESQMEADYAIYYEEERKMEAQDNVVIINRKGEKLNTEHLFWDEKSGKIISEEFVKITTTEEIIYGDGLEANQDFTKYKIKNIKGTINIKDEAETDAIESSAPVRNRTNN